MKESGHDKQQSTVSQCSQGIGGVSLTHGSPRQHIWTFAAAQDESGQFSSKNCPCINEDLANSATRPPAFVREDYFCDTGAQTLTSSFFAITLCGMVLVACGPLNDCCSFNNRPWFYKQLPQPTTDSIEMRVCRDQGHVAIEMIEIYVQ